MAHRPARKASKSPFPSPGRAPDLGKSDTQYWAITAVRGPGRAGHAQELPRRRGWCRVLFITEGLSASISQSEALDATSEHMETCFRARRSTSRRARSCGKGEEVSVCAPGAPPLPLPVHRRRQAGSHAYIDARGLLLARGSLTARADFQAARSRPQAAPMPFPRSGERSKLLRFYSCSSVLFLFTAACLNRRPTVPRRCRHRPTGAAPKAETARAQKMPAAPPP